VNIEQKAVLIDQYTQEWLELNGKTEAKPKDVMEHLIKKGLYDYDNKNGLPLRKDLRTLDDMNKLYLIKGLVVERKKINRYWSFQKI
jgi:hypothetical protein